MDAADAFIKTFERRQRMLVECQKLYNSEEDTISLMLLQVWMNNHRAWIEERQSAYDAFKGAQNG